MHLIRQNVNGSPIPAGSFWHSKMRVAEVKCCIRCEQIYSLLNLVAELKDEVERLRAERECKREMDLCHQCSADSLTRVK